MAIGLGFSFLLTQPLLQHLADLLYLYHKPVVPIHRINFNQGTIAQVLLHMALFFEGAQDIAGDAYQ